MIRFIHTEDTLALRSLVLRNGLAEQDCINPQDDLPDTFHLGYYSEEGKLVCILTCQHEQHPKLPHDGYRLRGMATHPDARRKGYARELLLAAMEHIKTQLQIPYLWFNARAIAYPFYESLGFEYMSDEFDIPGIGPHKEMFKLL